MDADAGEIKDSDDDLIGGCYVLDIGINGPSSILYHKAKVYGLLRRSSPPGNCLLIGNTMISVVLFGLWFDADDKKEGLSPRLFPHGTTPFCCKCHVPFRRTVVQNGKIHPKNSCHHEPVGQKRNHSSVSLFAKPLWFFRNQGQISGQGQPIVLLESANASEGDGTYFRKFGHLQLDRKLRNVLLRPEKGFPEVGFRSQ